MVRKVLVAPFLLFCHAATSHASSPAYSCEASEVYYVASSEGLAEEILGETLFIASERQTALIELDRDHGAECKAVKEDGERAVICSIFHWGKSERETLSELLLPLHSIPDAFSLSTVLKQRPREGVSLDSSVEKYRNSIMNRKLTLSCELNGWAGK